MRSGSAALAPIRTPWGIAPPAIVLLYHRVAAPPLDPQLLCVSPGNFVQHLEVIKSCAQVVRLSDLWEPRQLPTIPARPLIGAELRTLAGAVRRGSGRRMGASGRRPDRRPRVVVTFDDGYADNLLQAKPLLERYDVPATVFVTTGYLGGDREFWWDELERMVLVPRALPETLSLSIRGRVQTWRLNGSTHADEREQSAGSASHWSVLDDHDPSPCHRLYRDLFRLIRPLPAREREDVLHRLRNWAGTDRTPRATHRPLTVDELAELTCGGIIEVGGHTVTHPVLSALRPQEQYEEMARCKADLESMLPGCIHCFSYPYGTRRDYTPATTARVREAGFSLACSNFPGQVGDKADRFQIPRILVRNWSGEDFERQWNKACCLA